MDLISKHHENQTLHTLLKTQQENNTTPPQFQSIMHSSNSDFPVAIAVLALLAVALLLASYYIFVIKCCLSWQNFDPLRRFSISRSTQNDVDQLMLFSPMVDIHRGLDEWLINNIPAFQYKSGGCNDSSGSSNNRSFRRCAVCLNEFKEKEILRILPKCGHNFHLDCIDVWLLKNASCPLCRSNISGRTKYPIDQIIAPSSSPQEMLSPLFSGSLSININDIDQDYLVIELLEEETSISRSVSRGASQRKTELKGINEIDNFVKHCKKSRKSQCRSTMGDECISIRQKDEEFMIQQPIRRSISMDSATDRGMYLQVQEIIRQNNDGIFRNNNNDMSSSSSSSSVHDECNSSNGRLRRSSFFSFGHGRGSRTSSSILPLVSDR